MISLCVATSSHIAGMARPTMPALVPALSARSRVAVLKTPTDGDDTCVDEICEAPLEKTAEELAEERWKQGIAYAEESRKYRRTVYMHDEWVKHRSSDRFFSNMNSIFSSGVGKNLEKEIGVVTGTAAFVVIMNTLLVSYQDFGGVSHPGPLAFIGNDLGHFSLPLMPFTVMMPALSLLLVFRNNVGYNRWNEARTLWGGVVNNCRNIVRQSNTFYPETVQGDEMRDRMAGNTAAFCKALRNFLRGPTDDAQFKSELYELVDEGLMSEKQVNTVMGCKNRPFFFLSAMSANLREAKLDPIDRSRIDTTIAVLGDLTGACERIFKSPVPLVYTRHTARFLTVFTILLPFGLWESTGNYWNHWVTIPLTYVISYFLYGIEEIGIQTEEPFSILPLEALCNGAIAAVLEEMVTNKIENKYDGADTIVEPSNTGVPIA